jgi:maltose O-acetyltransferase
MPLLRQSSIHQLLFMKNGLKYLKILKHMNKIFYQLLLQFKFIFVAIFNFIFNVIPYPFRNMYLGLFRIKVPLSSSIHRGVKFFHIGNIECGKNTVINFGCYLDNRRKIVIGKNVGIAHDTKIYTLGHDLDDPEFKTKGKGVSIKDNVFIFSNALIMPGVTIGEGAVVLAGSVVVHDVESHSIVGGNPAKKIKMRTAAIDYKNQYNYWFAL